MGRRPRRLPRGRPKPPDSGSPPAVYHLEVGRSFHRARLFNLDRSGLDGVLGPWSAGQVVEIGEREWDPRESTLTILEGRELDPSELALGQGWNSATRVSRDVSAEMTAAAAREGSPSPPSNSALAEDERLRAFGAGFALGILAEQLRVTTGWNAY